MYVSSHLGRQTWWKLTKTFCILILDWALCLTTELTVEIELERAGEGFDRGWEGGEGGIERHQNTLKYGNYVKTSHNHISKYCYISLNIFCSFNIILMYFIPSQRHPNGQRCPYVCLKSKLEYALSWVY